MKGVGGNAYALFSRRPRARYAAAGRGAPLVFHPLVRGNVLVPSLAVSGLHLPAGDAALVHSGAALVRRTVDSLAGGGHRRGARDRFRAGARISSAAGIDMLHRVVLIGAALVGCGSPQQTAAGQVDARSPAALVAERIRTRIEPAGVVMDPRAAGEPVYASLVLPSFYERRL